MRVRSYAFVETHGFVMVCTADISTPMNTVSYNSVRPPTMRCRGTQCVRLCPLWFQIGFYEFFVQQVIAHAASVHLSAESDPRSHAVLPPNYALIGRGAADALALKLLKRLNWCRSV